MSRTDPARGGDGPRELAELQREAERLASEITALLDTAGGQLGKVHRLEQERDGEVVSNAWFVERRAAANSGAVSNLRNIRRAILEARLPASPWVAGQAAAASRSLRGGADTVDSELESYLADLEAHLEDRARDERAGREDTARLEEQREALLERADRAGGVYVYTFPTYYRHAHHALDHPLRHLYKIGHTSGDTNTRVLTQARQAAAPEDPIVVRVYRHADLAPAELERKFHTMLEAAGHTHPDADRRVRGIEWFATTEVFLDAVAELLGADVEQPEFEPPE